MASGASSRSGQWRCIARLREEGGRRIMRQVLRVWPRAAWERRGLFCRRYARLRSTRTVRSTDRKFVAEACYPCGLRSDRRLLDLKQSRRPGCSPSFSPECPPEYNASESMTYIGEGPHGDLVVPVILQVTPVHSGASQHIDYPTSKHSNVRHAFSSSLNRCFSRRPRQPRPIWPPHLRPAPRFVFNLNRNHTSRIHV